MPDLLTSLKARARDWRGKRDSSISLQRIFEILPSTGSPKSRLRSRKIKREWIAPKKSFLEVRDREKKSRHG